MASPLLDPKFETSFNQKFREKRFKVFTSILAKIKSDKSIRILDIGGLEVYWERMKFAEQDNVQITLLNLFHVPVKYANFTSVTGNACSMPEFKDKEFDIVFSNSVIEHLFTKDNQVKMAKEAMRVGKYYYIQTPNFYFPIEPHWIFPMFQFLPVSTRVFLTKHFNLGNHPKEPNKEAAITRVKEVKLLTEKEMKQLFPDGEVYREMFMGLKKSITMYRSPVS